MPQPNREELIRWVMANGEEPKTEPQFRVVTEAPLQPKASAEIPAPEPAATSAPTRKGGCPKCGDVMRTIGGPGKRCQACGYQPRVNQATGISRAAIDSYESGRANLHPQGFAMALARIIGFGRR